MAWHSGRTSVFGRWTFSVLRWPASDEWAVIWVNRPLQVSQLGQLSLSSFRGRSVSSELQSDVRSGGAIWWMQTGWRPGVVDWGGVFTGCLPRVQLFISTHLALQHHWLLPVNCHFDDCKARLVKFHSKMRYIRMPGCSFLTQKPAPAKTNIKLQNSGLVAFSDTRAGTNDSKLAICLCLTVTLYMADVWVIR